MVPSTNLVLSLRSLGYSFNAAIADLLDNSLSNEARHIKIDFGLDPEPFISILDDGSGMSKDKLRQAMTLGGTSGESRDESDLGRFGLGLKTASLSQARVLRVLTKQEGSKMIGRKWDIPLIERTGLWLAPRLDAKDIDETPSAIQLSGQEHGTLVVWSELDQVVEPTQDPQSVILGLFEELDKHLALVFHRFLSGETERKVQLKIGEKTVVAADPFLKNHPATQHLPEDLVKMGDHTLKISPYVLPHVSKLTAKDRELAQIDGAMRDNQGFYIYRNNRIIGPSSWFRLARKGEMTKLARGAIDVPNSLDSEWKLDIKKSSAVPPESVKQAIRRVVDKFVESSVRVNRFRGRDVASDQEKRIWKVQKLRAGFQYKLNREHPAIEKLRETPGLDGSELELFLQLVEGTIPAQDIYNRLSVDSAIETEKLEVTDLVNLAKGLFPMIPGNSAEEKLDVLFGLEPFSLKTEYREAVEAKWTEISQHA